MSTVLALSACSRGESGEPGPGASPAHRSSANVPSAKAPSANVPSTAAPFTEVTAPLDDFYRAPGRPPPTPGAHPRGRTQSVQQIPGVRRPVGSHTTTMPDGALTTAVASGCRANLPGRGLMWCWEHGTLGIEQKCMPSATGRNRSTDSGDRRVAGLRLGWSWHRLSARSGGLFIPYNTIASGLARSGPDALRACGSSTACRSVGGRWWGHPRVANLRLRQRLSVRICPGCAWWGGGAGAAGGHADVPEGTRDRRSRANSWRRS